MTIIQPGMRSTLQDHGRSGLKKFGIPASGVMDRSSHDLANQALGNFPQSATLEILLGNVSMICERDSWIALSGAGQAFIDDLTVSFGTPQPIKRGQQLRISYPTDGLWTYLAIVGGWTGTSWFGSRSVWPEGNMGQTLKAGETLCSDLTNTATHSPHIPTQSNISLKKNPIIRLWQGPQWSQFSPSAREALFTSEWTISPRSNRAGYRLLGSRIECPVTEMISEPTLLGSLQITPQGTAIALLNDGPTIGGYPKIALIHADDLDAFRQLQPGSHFHFQPFSHESH